jgi:hypothetical protein
MNSLAISAPPTYTRLIAKFNAKRRVRADPPVGRVLSRRDKRIHMAYTWNLHRADYKQVTRASAGDKIAVQMAVTAEVRGIATGG